MSGPYPKWCYFPTRTAPPEWVAPFVEAFVSVRSEIDTEAVSGLTSDGALAALREPLEALGYEVERGKRAAEKIRRPVLFGEQGAPRLTYEVDAVHDELGVVVEIEAGRGARGNAVYRDLIRTSLIVGARYLVVGVMVSYRHQSGGREVEVPSYDDTLTQLDAIYASGRLQLPFDGVLLVGY